MTIVIKDNGKRRLEFDSERLKASLEGYFEGLSIAEEFKQAYIKKTVRQVSTKPEIDFKDINKLATNNALELIMEVKGEDGEVDLMLLSNTQFQMLLKEYC